MLKPDPMINDIASLIADPSRCIILMSLLGGQRTAGELANEDIVKLQYIFHKKIGVYIINSYLNTIFLTIARRFPNLENPFLY